MAYTDGKAAGRRTPGDTAGDKAAGAPPVASAQAKTQGQSAMFRSYPVNTGASNQVRFGGGKGLSVAGRPSAQAVDSKDRTYPAVENPSK